MQADMKFNQCVQQQALENSNNKVWKWHIQDPASQRLTWNKPPKSVLVVKKIQDASLLQPFKELCVFLTEQKNMIVYVESKVLADTAIAGDESFGAVIQKFCTFREGEETTSHQRTGLY